MTDFPIHVYRSPGNYELRGKSYKIASVADQDALHAHIDAGWHLTLAQAFQAAGEAAIVRRKVADWRSQKKASKRRLEFKVAKAMARAAKAAKDAGLPSAPVPQPAPLPVLDDKEPPTREEMLQQAEILGIKADKRWSDATLLAKISAAIKEA
jgi:hypothetical protein